MSATITTDGVIIRARVMEPELALEIPGGQRSKSSGNWVYPLSMQTCRAFRQTFGDDLTVLPALTGWAREAVAKEEGRIRRKRACRRCGNRLSRPRLQLNKMFCVPCERLNRREAKARTHERRVGDVYGLEPGDYGVLLEAQGGRCPVKGCRANGTTRRLSVEHEHALGNTREAVRGLMCRRHNDWIGQAGDDPEVFESIAAYLRDPPARRVLGKR
jgi:hypothetical protein